MATDTMVQIKNRNGCCPECGLKDHADAVDRAGNVETGALLAALGDPIRIGITSLLSQHDRLCVCEIVDAFPLGQPTISHHLRVLREAGLVDGERRGQWVYYGLNRHVLKQATQALLRLL
jgi:ArsR family transcriptional regulator